MPKVAEILDQAPEDFTEVFKEHAEQEYKMFDFCQSLKETSQSERTAVQWVSTRDIDHSGDIVVPHGMDKTSFEKIGRPVFFNHKIFDPPIGSDLWIKNSKDEGILAKTRYSTTQKADDIWTLKVEGHMKAQSIGFAVLDAVREGQDGFNETATELRNRWGKFPRKGVRRIIKNWILFEHSDMTIPDNPNALLVALQKGINISEEMEVEIKAAAEEAIAGIANVELEDDDPIKTRKIERIAKKRKIVIPLRRPEDIERAIKDKLDLYMGRV